MPRHPEGVTADASPDAPGKIATKSSGQAMKRTSW
jgi:hypothetical protein